MGNSIKLKDEDLRRELRTKKRKNMKKDFFELLRRASKTTKAN